MSFKHLADLSALMPSAQKPQPVVEARDPSADFDGIKSVVTDNFADLEDNLGKSGKLMQLFKDHGLDKLDTSEDESGRTMSGRIAEAAKLIAKAKKMVMDTMDEMELMVASAAPEKSDKMDESLLAEGKNYDDSSEFTDELHKVGSKILELKSIIRQPRWINWMQVTDHNFGTTCVSLNNDMHGKLVELDKAYDALEEELLRAE